MTRQIRTAAPLAFAAAALCAAALPLSNVLKSSSTTTPVTQAAAPAARMAEPAIAFRAEPAAEQATRAAVQPVLPVKVGSEAAVRSNLKFDQVRWGGKKVRTLTEESRLLLVQAAAQKAGLHQVGLSYRDVYGVIEAETSWIPRTGMGKNGVSSYGLAQFEPRTAKGLGLKDPNDPLQAVYFAAINMKDGAKWAARKIAHLDLTPAQYQQKLREGVSIYYNLSVKGRNKWNGLNTAQLPVETQRHIRNVRAGAQEAEQLARRLYA